MTPSTIEKEIIQYQNAVKQKATELQEAEKRKEEICQAEPYLLQAEELINKAAYLVGPMPQWIKLKFSDLIRKRLLFLNENSSSPSPKTDFKTERKTIWLNFLVFLASKAIDKYEREGSKTKPFQSKECIFSQVENTWNLPVDIEGNKTCLDGLIFFELPQEGIPSLKSQIREIGSYKGWVWAINPNSVWVNSWVEEDYKLYEILKNLSIIVGIYSSEFLEEIKHSGEITLTVFSQKFLKLKPNFQDILLAELEENGLIAFLDIHGFPTSDIDRAWTLIYNEPKKVSHENLDGNIENANFNLGFEEGDTVADHDGNILGKIQSIKRYGQGHQVVLTNGFTYGAKKIVKIPEN